jgi:hypothetical protein
VSAILSSLVHWVSLSLRFKRKDYLAIGFERKNLKDRGDFLLLFRFDIPAATVLGPCLPTGGNGQNGPKKPSPNKQEYLV